MNTRHDMTYITAVTAVLLSAACGNPSVQQCESDWSGVDTVVYDPDYTPQIMREVAIDSTWYVRLETVEESMIGSIDEVIFGDSTIIVADKYIARAILLFDYQGRFVGRMSNLGNGPGEYLSLLNIAELPDGTIAVYDSRRQKIDFFDERGNYLEKMECNVYSSSVQFIDKDAMVFNSFIFRDKENRTDKGYASYVVKNGRMKTLYKFGDIRFKNDSHFSRYHNLYSYDGRVYCNVNFDDVIYELDRSGAKARYRLIMKPDQASNHPISSEVELKKLWDRYSYFNGGFVELENYAYFNVSLKEPCYRDANLIFRREDCRTYEMIDDFNNPMMAFFGYPEYRYGDNCLVSWQTSSSIISNVDYMEEKSDGSSILKLVEGMNRDDNPVLFFYRIAF